MPSGDPTYWAWVFYASEWAIRVFMLIIVPFRRAPATAKGWLLLIFFEPWIGLSLYLLIGRVKLPRRQRARLTRLPEAMSGVLARLENHPHIFHPEVDPALAPAVALTETLARTPILGGNAVEMLTDYNGTFARLVEDIDGAKDHVHLEFYIFVADEATAPILAALGRAVQRGVRCRVLADAIGSRKGIRELRGQFEQLGVEFHEMLPISLAPWRKARLDLRNHRKIAVIDGRIGYTGSQNMICAHFKSGLAYEDLMTRLTGPAVMELQFVFAADWYLETEETLDSQQEFPDPELTGDLAVQALPSGPAFPSQNNQRVFVALVHGAQQRVTLTSPYFVPDEPLLQAMQTAAQRGVDVHLVVSAAGDQKIVALAQESYYEELLEAGVKIHIYQRNFLHAKHLSIDDHVAVIGTSNLDIRSFAINAELMLLIYCKAITSQLQAEQEGYFERSELLNADLWRRRGSMRKVAQNLARLLSPLL